jgi:hypothetical protein
MGFVPGKFESATDLEKGVAAKRHSFPSLSTLSVPYIYQHDACYDEKFRPGFRI